MIEKILIILVLLLWIFVFINIMKKRFAKVVCVKATVADKYKFRAVSKTEMATPRDKYTIVFITEDGKKLSFNVSEFSYDGYYVNETGTLKYKGNKLIKFG